MSARHVLKKGRRYHFRIRVPADLIPLFGRAEIHRALGTSDFRTARSMASSLAGRLSEQFAQLRYRTALASPLPDLVATARSIYARQLPVSRAGVIAGHVDGGAQGRGGILTLRQIALISDLGKCTAKGSRI